MKDGSLKGQRNPREQSQGESALVPLCFSKAARTRQGREGEADGDEEGDQSVTRSPQASQGATEGLRERCWGGHWHQQRGVWKQCSPGGIREQQ